jgi:hypothetical protein
VTVAVLLVVLAVPGCSRENAADDTADVKLDFTIRPDPPQVGAAQVSVRLTGAKNNPVSGATVKLEGNMNHAGMQPVFADAKEVEAGRYQADLELTMGGDWFVLVDARLADGRVLKRKIDVRGVRSR